jgi:hypothetical protein
MYPQSDSDSDWYSVRDSNPDSNANASGKRGSDRASGVKSSIKFGNNEHPIMVS